MLLAIGGSTFSNAYAQRSHPIRFFLDPALTSLLSDTQIKSRLTAYANDLAEIFERETNRELTFNPETGVSVSALVPYDGTGSHLPAESFELWIHANLSLIPMIGSHGGFMTFDSSGAGVAGGLFWDKIHDPDSLTGPDSDTSEYWKQIHNIIHEFQHVFGAGISEYYNLKTVHDLTGVSPVSDINYVNAQDSYWSQRSDYFTDPLYLWRPSDLTKEALVAGVRFADVTKAIINGSFRTGLNHNETLPDLTQSKVRVIDQASGAPLANVRVRIWNVASSTPYTASLITDMRTDDSGHVSFDWGGGLNNIDHLLLIKAHRGYGISEASQWFSIFDAQQQFLIDGRESPLITFETFVAPDEISFSDWAIELGLSGTDGLPSSDPDLDGLSNLQEYHGETNPSSRSAPLVSQSTEAIRNWHFSVRKSRHSKDITLSASIASSLNQMDWVEHISDQQSTQGDVTIHTFSIPRENSQNVFLRTRIMLNDASPE